MQQFYQRFHGRAQVTPTAKELAQATALLTAHGREKAQYLLTFSHQAAQATRYDPQVFGGILHYTDRALAAYDARAAQGTHATTRQAAADERTQREQYQAWEQRQLAQRRTALLPAALAALEAEARARLVAAGTPAVALPLAVRVAVDQVLAAQAGLPVLRGLAADAGGGLMTARGVCGPTHAQRQGLEPARTRASVRDACFLAGHEGKRAASAWVAQSSDTPEAGVRGREAHGHAPWGLATPVSVSGSRCLAPSWQACSVLSLRHTLPVLPRRPMLRLTDAVIRPPWWPQRTLPRAGVASGAPCRLHTPANRGVGTGTCSPLLPGKRRQGRTCRIRSLIWEPRRLPLACLHGLLSQEDSALISEMSAVISPQRTDGEYPYAPPGQVTSPCQGRRWTRSNTCCALMVAGCLLSMIWFRVNIEPSVPYGVYRLHAVNEPLPRGTLVSLPVPGSVQRWHSRGAAPETDRSHRG